MKNNYNKPEVKIIDMSLQSAIAALDLSTGKAATYENVDSNTWNEWSSMFE